MKKFTPLLLIVGLLLMNSGTLHAESPAIDFLRSIGKIYSVIAVIVVILLGIAFFLYRMDNKLTKLENQINNEQ
ncbi:MAG: CcmD family protein [Bacteroidota bacterium]